jgi:hypothetical protein
MNFAKFLKAAKSEELKQKAVAGFNERQKEREKAFEDRSKSLAPSDKFYSRSYNL